MTMYYCHKCRKIFIGSLLAKRCDCGNAEWDCFKKDRIVMLNQSDIGLGEGVLWIWDEQEL